MIADDGAAGLDESVVEDAHLLGISASSITGTRALTGGRGGRTWAIDAAGERYVLHRRAGGPGRSIEYEVLATSAAAEVGVGPAVVAHDPEGGLLLTRWIPGRAASAPGVVGSHLVPAVRALKALHSVVVIDGVPVADVLPAVDPLASRAGYLEASGRKDAGLAELVAALTAHALQRPTVLIHGDPVPGNLIVASGSMHLVDFEYAGAGDPWYELGHLAAAVHLSSSQIAEVVAAYEDSPMTGGAHHELQESAVEAWSYVAAQAWVAWVDLGQDAGARSARWHRWAARASQRLDTAIAHRRIERLTAQLRAETS